MDNIIERIKTKAIELFNESKEMLASMDEVREWDSMEEATDNIKAIATFIGHVTECVGEAVADIEDTVSNSDKLDAAIDAIKDLTEFPFWVEYMMGSAIKMLVSTIYQGNKE